jgi:hypothetical protein
VKIAGSDLLVARTRVARSPREPEDLRVGALRDGSPRAKDGCVGDGVAAGTGAGCVRHSSAGLGSVSISSTTASVAPALQALVGPEQFMRRRSRGHAGPLGGGAARQRSGRSADAELVVRVEDGSSCRVTPSTAPVAGLCKASEGVYHHGSQPMASRTFHKCAL